MFSVNQLYGFGAQARRIGAWQVAASAELIGSSPGWEGFTVRQRINISAILVTGGSKVRATLNSSSTAGGFILGNAYIGHAAASGDPYDFEAAPTQLTFNGGNAGAIVGANSSIISDEVNFSIQSGKNLIISAYFSGASAIASRNLTGWQGYYRNLANDAATVNATGYTMATEGAAYLISKVEAFV